jgi:hypothetical protein
MNERAFGNARQLGLDFVLAHKMFVRFERWAGVILVR